MTRRGEEEEEEEVVGDARIDAGWGPRYRVEAKRTRYSRRGMEEGVPRGRLKVAAGPHTRLGRTHTHGALHTVLQHRRVHRTAERPGSARARCNVNVCVCLHVCVNVFMRVRGRARASVVIRRSYGGALCHRAHASEK